jgi:3-hydroxyisobutyrate dehydrogenase-like beta-hydroxyacid dehydrogenase
MGVSIAASAKNSGNAVYWASEGRSPESKTRAEEVGLLDAGSVKKMVETCSAIISVCPPASSEAVADEVLSYGFKGLYIDANAISPGRAERIAQAMSDAGTTFVDGSIIGGPAWKPNSTWLYLSGEASEQAADLFTSGPLETHIVGDEIGKASALKMCFAAYTIGTTGLRCAGVATAEALVVREALDFLWSLNGSTFATAASVRVRGVTANAWRFAGEMEEIAATMDEAGLPGEFFQAAADVYRRMAEFKGAPEKPALDEVLAALLNGNA